MDSRIATRTAGHSLRHLVEAACITAALTVVGTLSVSGPQPRWLAGVLVVVTSASVAVAFSAWRTTDERERHIRDREQRFRSLVQNSSDVTVVLDDGARITYVSPSVERIFGWTSEELDGRVFLDLVHPDDIPPLRRFVRDVADRPGEIPLVECRLRHADGTWRHVETVGNNRFHDPAIRGFVLNSRDVSERKALEEQLEHRAFHDALTGLANRALFTDRVEHATARRGRSDEAFAVLILDLDGFKAVNDRLGHVAGDALLEEVAARLRACVRDSDTVARLGGDEFALLLEEVEDEYSPARVADRILDALGRPFDVDGEHVSVGASIGIVFGSGADRADELVRNADIAMYTAKDAGRGRFEVFEPSMHAAVLARLELESELRAAIDREDLEVHYQPIIVLESGDVTGMEALVRWRHPSRGLVPPSEFIPVAEATGLVVPLGRWVLRAACQQLREWHELFPTRPPMHVSVNISAAQLLQSDLVGDVRQALEEADVDPTCLQLELTESALIVDTETTIARLRELKVLGVRLAIDDFGTGYSSLSYLQRFPVDVLKIDRSFIADVDRTDPALVRAIVELGRTLDLETVAEGIERDDQLARFRALRCDLGQGYLFARPVTPQEATTFLAERATVIGIPTTVPVTPDLELT